MGEIIVRPLPPTELPFTGERLTSALTGQTEIEHVHRYLLAREFCRGMDVVDVASGEGYGAALIAQVARSVTGVEIAEDAVLHASASYPSTKLRFVCGDARAMPIADASTDVVVSFETIEHIAEHTQFLSEVRRVLRPDGRLIVSTPERDNYSPTESSANPYHVKEMTEAEFVALLGSAFRHVAYLAQRPMRGSVMLPAGDDLGASTAPTCFERRGAEHFEASAGLSRPQYLVAVCSDNPIAALAPSVYIETSRLGLLTPEEMELQLAQARQQLEHLTRVAAQQETAPVEQARYDEPMAALRSEVTALHVELTEARAQLAAQDAERQSLEHANELAEQACAFTRQQLAECQRALSECKDRCGRQEHDLANAQAAAADLRQLADGLRAHGDLILASTSWRVTAPLRAASRVLRRDRR